MRRLARFDPEWHRLRFEAALLDGDDAAAFFHLRRLAAGQPWDAGLHIHCAHVLAGMKRRPEAAAHLMHALFLNPRVLLWPIDPTAEKRGETAAQAGDWPRAVQAFLVAAHQPDAPAGRVVDLLLAQGSVSDAAGVRQTMSDLARRLKNEKDPQAAALLIDGAPLCALGEAGGGGAAGARAADARPSAKRRHAAPLGAALIGLAGTRKPGEHWRRR